MKDTLTADEAAELARVTSCQLRNHIRRGHLKARKVKVDRHYSYPYVILRADFNAWMETRKKKG